MNRKITLILGCLITLSLVLSACAAEETGTGAQTVTGQVTETTTPTTPDTPTAAEPAEPVKDPNEPIYGGTISHYSGTAEVWDPFYSTRSNFRAAALVYETLVTYDWWKGPAGTNEWSFDYQYAGAPDNVWTGALAESWETPTPTNAIFYLRQGVMWQNTPGMPAREFVADDVVFNFERYMEPGSVVQPPLGFAVTAIDRYTVEISWDSPSGSFVGPIAQWTIVRPEVIEQYGDSTDWRNANGTGPYYVVDIVPDSMSIYEWNPNYYMKDPEGRSLPYVETVKRPSLPDTSTRITALRTGQLDIAHYVGWQDADSLRETNPELEWHYMFYTPEIVLINQRTPPFGPSLDEDARKVRRALWMAVDFDAIVEGYYRDNAEVISSCMLPAYGIDELLIENLPPDSKELFSYNPEKARQLLTEAGYPNGIEIEVHVGSWYGDYFSIYKSYWDAVGINTEIDLLEFGSLVATLDGHEWQGLQQWWNGFGLWTGHHYAHLEDGTLKSANDSGVEDPVIDELFWSLSEVENLPLERQLEISTEIILRGLDQAYMMFLPARYTYNFWQPWVKGFHGEHAVGPSESFNVVSRVWVDPDLK